MNSEDHAAYKDLPKYVVPSTLDDGGLVEGWGETTVLGSVEDVAVLKESDGGPIFVHGSGELARSLGAAGLLDRYNLLVFPVVLGAGKSLFADMSRPEQQLKLRESATYPNGVIKAVYDVVR